MVRYKQRHDGEGFEVPVGEVYRLACCDCGLVHDVVWIFEDGKLGMATRRNERATAAKRRGNEDKDDKIARLRAALEQITRDCTARKAVMIARNALTPNGLVTLDAKRRRVDQRVRRQKQEPASHP